jgi:hypothetical protein
MRILLLTIVFVLVAGVGWGEETITVIDASPGMEWEIEMPSNCANCIEITNWGLVIRIWPDGTVKKRQLKWIQLKEAE